MTCLLTPCCVQLWALGSYSASYALDLWERSRSKCPYTSTATQASVYLSGFVIAVVFNFFFIAFYRGPCSCAIYMHTCCCSCTTGPVHRRWNRAFYYDSTLYSIIVLGKQSNYPELGSYPGLLATVFVACSTDAGEGLVNLSHAVTCLGVCERVKV